MKRLTILITIAVILVGGAAYLFTKNYNQVPKWLDLVKTGDTLAIAEAIKDNPQIINAADSIGATALMRAAGNGDLAVAKLLIKSGADVNQVSVKGFTPLMLAAHENQPEMVKLLLQKGAEIDKFNSEHHTALAGAVSKGNTECVQILLDNKAALIAPDGQTLLQIAALNGKKEIVELLLVHGADVNESPINGVTALMLAASENKLEICRLLVEKGADVKMQDTEDKTAADRTTDAQVKEYLLSSNGRVKK